MDAADAREWIERYTASDKPPTLTSDEVDALLRVAVREPSWLSVVAYGTGAIVSSGGFRFRAAVGGVSGDTEPVWPTYPDTVNDGTVVWEAAGDITYDLHGAAAIGWEWKAARVAGAYDTSQQGSSFSRSQMYRACVEQANYHRGLALGDLSTTATGTGYGAGTTTIAPPEHTIVATPAGLRYSGQVSTADEEWEPWP